MEKEIELSTDPKELSLFWLIGEFNRIMPVLDYSALKKSMRPKNIRGEKKTLKKRKVSFYRRMPTGKCRINDEIREQKPVCISQCNYWCRLLLYMNAETISLKTVGEDNFCIVVNYHPTDY